MRELQGSFGRLRVPLEIGDMEKRADLIESCFRLHNLCTRLVGINQIRNVYALCGVRVMAGGYGKDLKVSCFPINGNMTVLGLFMFKKSGIKR